MEERIGVKIIVPEKLKRIPNDLISYIQTEAEAIKDANDKQIISSYCLSKLDTVNWYIQLLEVGSEKYVVPHTKQQLQNIRSHLMACHEMIMGAKIINHRDHLDIKYPKGYEG